MSAALAGRRLQPLLRIRTLRVDQALKVVQQRRAQLLQREQALAGARARLIELQQERTALESQLHRPVAGVAQDLIQRMARHGLLGERCDLQREAIEKLRKERDAALHQLELAQGHYRRAQGRLQALQEQLRQWQLEQARAGMRAQENVAEELVTSRAAAALQARRRA